MGAQALNQRIESLELNSAISKSAYMRSFRSRRLAVDNTLPFAVAFDNAVKSTLINSGIFCTSVTITSATSNGMGGVSIAYSFSVILEQSIGSAASSPAALVAAVTSTLTTAATSGSLLTAINSGSGSSAWSSLITSIAAPSVTVISISNTSPTPSPTTQGPNNQQAVAIGVGVGIGLGVPIVAGTAAMAYYYNTNAKAPEAQHEPVSQDDIELSQMDGNTPNPSSQVDSADVQLDVQQVVVN